MSTAWCHAGRDRLHTLMLTCLLSYSGTICPQGIAYDDNVRTLQVMVDDNPLLPPVFKLGSRSTLNIHWDWMSHEYTRFTYRIEQCNWDWSNNEELFESEFLSGSNNLPVEEYTKSFNTTQEYTHYTLTLPNENVTLLLSGNYRVLIYTDEAEAPVIEARFRVVEAEATLVAQVSSNTDIGFNRNHQQVSLQLKYGTIDVTDPATQIHAIVVQNQRASRTIICPPPNIRNTRGAEWTHCEALIFPAGNEYHKFEILDVNQGGMNVDNIRWYEPFHHATLWADKPQRNYLSAKDHNGISIPRAPSGHDDTTEAEYIVVHFTLDMPRQNHDIYVSGIWSNTETDPKCKMDYNETDQCYEAGILLKQGYYEYQYITQDGDTAPTMGNFWQKENEYQTYIYYREDGGRHDRIVAYSLVRSQQ